MKIALLVLALFFCGCSTVDRGRFSVIDLDLRTPEQILTGTVENTCIYGGTNQPPQITKTEPRAFPFELLFKFLEVMKGRIRIISLEWKTSE